MDFVENKNDDGDATVSNRKISLQVYKFVLIAQYINIQKYFIHEERILCSSYVDRGFSFLI